jgi:hypothetical protein
MKKPASRRCAFHSIVIAVAFLPVFFIALRGSVCAGFMDQFKEKIYLMQLVGAGELVSYQRNVDTQDPLFPIEVVRDGFKMICVYQNYPGHYLVEWSWRALLKNRSSGAVEITFEYKLTDQDGFLLESSSDSSRKIAAGQTVAIEKTGTIPYETAERVKNSDWYVHILN